MSEKFYNAVCKAIENDLGIQPECLLAIPGIWEILSEHYNNDAIEIMQDEAYHNPETDEDFIIIAEMVYGSEIRDNSRQEKIEIGKHYHEHGE